MDGRAEVMAFAHPGEPDRRMGRAFGNKKPTGANE